MVEIGFGAPEAAAGEDGARDLAGARRLGRCLVAPAGKEHDPGGDRKDREHDKDDPPHRLQARFAGTNLRAEPFMHQRWPVGGGPSSKT